MLAGPVSPAAGMFLGGVTWLVVLAGALLIGGCAQASPMPRPTVAPTPTPTPTPLPTPTPTQAPPTATPSVRLEVGDFPPGFNPRPDPTRLGEMLRLLSLVPEGHETMVYVDLLAMQEHPETLDSLEGDGSLLPSGVPPLESGRLDRVVTASVKGSGEGLLGLEGELTLADLLELAANVGIIVAPDPEIHRDYEIWNGDLFGLLAVYLVEVDDLTVVLSQENAVAGTASSNRIKAALDSADGLVASVLDTSRTSALAGGLPSGLITALTGDCSLIDVATGAQPVSLPGCTGSGATAAPAGDNVLEVHLLMYFDSEEQAKEASGTLGEILEGLGKGTRGIRQLAQRQEDQLVRVRLRGHDQELFANLISVVRNLGASR